ncbi:calcium-binding protein, partial [Ciceribacter sp. RN22]|uniref:calcium-binding protein n=1 Tax=Ciceribacter sp. RN22 TaxID=2954932 RepID=UPI0035AE241B|nr:hypothetical protein [Ciceribacter sp. RN22]
PTAGTSSADWLAGSDVNDILTGGGGADTLLGFGGNDTIHVSDLAFARIDGGAGTDSLVLDGSGISIVFPALASDTVTGIEMIDIGGSGANSVTLDLQSVLDMSDTTDTLMIVGGTDDSVTAVGFTATGGTETSGGVTFDVYTNAGATLWIDQDMQIAV